MQYAYFFYAICVVQESVFLEKRNSNLKRNELLATFSRESSSVSVQWFSITIGFHT